MKHKILVADDEKHLLRLLQISLGLDGYDVVMVSDGQEALSRIRQEMPDLIILDIMMPHLDGLAAVRQLKEDAATATIPVILLTARAQDSDLEIARKMGVAHYMTKPFDPTELNTLVRVILKDLAPQRVA